MAGSEDDNVVDLEEHREKKSGGKKESTAKQYKEIFKRMDRIQGASRLPEFTDRFYVVRADRGRILVQEDADDPWIVRVVDEKDLYRSIAQYLTKRVSHEAYAFTPSQMKACAEFWLLNTLELPTPRPFIWPGEEELGFQRLPWELAAGPTPTWDRLLGKVENVATLKQWFGSLFFSDSNIQQYVWIYGPGGDGKGSINRFLSKVFGAAYHSGLPPVENKEANWVFYILIGKRLVVFPDCDDPDFVVNGFFKSLTGEDPVTAEEKFGRMFTYKPACKYLVLSNVKPNLTSAKSNTRRIIYVELTEEKTPEVGFEAALWSEGGAFLASCMAEYLRQNPNRELPIKTDDGAIKEWIGEVEEEFEVAFEDGIQLSPNNFAIGKDMNAFLKKWWPGQKKKSDAFRDWLKRKHSISSKQRWLKAGSVVIGDSKQQRRIYEGIHMKYGEKTYETCNIIK